MIYLKETASPQEFKIIPRVYSADSMIITNETTNTSVTIPITPTISTYYLVINEVLDLKENNRYTLTVLDGTTVRYKDIIFCTNQDISTYSVNNGEYMEQTSTNDFITI